MPQRMCAWGGSAGGHLAGLLASAPERFLTSKLNDVSAAVRATCIMAGPTDLTNATFVESLRRSKEKSNSYTWFGKLYDNAPDLYRDASPITHRLEVTFGDVTVVGTDGVGSMSQVHVTVGIGDAAYDEKLFVNKTSSGWKLKTVMSL